MMKNLLRVAHTVIILHLFYHIFTGKTCRMRVVVAQLLLTIIRSVVEKRINSFRTKIQILLSFLIGYAMFPNKFRYLSWCFVLKGIQVHQTLKQIRKQSGIFNNDLYGKYIAFVFDMLRLFLNQFVFLWVFCIIYRICCDSVHEPLPEMHKIMYQMVVTASTIGYGDVTPKSDMQIIFFTFSIPILCSSFIIYTTSLVDIFSFTFLTQQQSKVKTTSQIQQD